MKLEYCLLDRYDDLQTLPSDARWTAIEVDSTDQAQARVDGFFGHDVTGAIIARRNRRGSLNLLRARQRTTHWRDVGSAHLQLYRFFDGALQARPNSGDMLRSWGLKIDDQDTKKLIVNLIGADVGMNASRAAVHRSVLSLTYALETMGLPRGDWNIGPCLAVFAEAQRAQGF